MSKLLSISINVDLLDESKFYKGKKGTYLNISGFLKEDPDNYGNYGFVTQDKVRTPENNAPILGNFKIKDFEINIGNGKPSEYYDSSAEVVNDKILPF